MMKIFKFSIETTDEQQIALPKDAKILCVATQFEKPMIWALVDPDLPIEPVKIFVYGTGNPIPQDTDRLVYIGSYHLMGGQLIWHVFREEGWKSQNI